MKSHNGKIVVLKNTRNLFGRLLYLSYKKKIDMQTIFGYTLTAVPLSLASFDGIKQSTNKAVLAEHLEKKTCSNTPAYDDFDTTIFDAMFILQSLTNLPATFGDIANVVLLILCRASCL